MIVRNIIINYIAEKMSIILDEEGVHKYVPDVCGYRSCLFHRRLCK